MLIVTVLTTQLLWSRQRAHQVGATGLTYLLRSTNQRRIDEKEIDPRLDREKASRSSLANWAYKFIYGTHLDSLDRQLLTQHSQCNQIGTQRSYCLLLPSCVILTYLSCQSEIDLTGPSL
ncbi:hypothetical protein V8C42DRAFT_333318 [Trichoderma barbatum]